MIGFCRTSQLASGALLTCMWGACACSADVVEAADTDIDFNEVKGDNTLDDDDDDDDDDDEGDDFGATSLQLSMILVLHFSV